MLSPVTLRVSECKEGSFFYHNWHQVLANGEKLGPCKYFYSRVWSRPAPTGTFHEITFVLHIVNQIQDEIIESCSHHKLTRTLNTVKSS